MTSDYRLDGRIESRSVGQEETGEIGNRKSCGTQGSPQFRRLKPGPLRGDPWCGFNTLANSCPASLLRAPCARVVLDILHAPA